jgi:hypothetical protein
MIIEMGGFVFDVKYIVFIGKVTKYEPYNFEIVFTNGRSITISGNYKKDVVEERESLIEEWRFSQEEKCI